MPQKPPPNQATILKHLVVCGVDVSKRTAGNKEVLHLGSRDAVPAWSPAAAGSHKCLQGLTIWAAIVSTWDGRGSRVDAEVAMPVPDSESKAIIESQGSEAATAFDQEDLYRQCARCAGRYITLTMQALELRFRRRIVTVSRRAR